VDNIPASLQWGRLKKYCINESYKRKALISHALVPLGKLPNPDYYDMERYADLLGK